jgi:hypothetical protein
MVSQKKTLTIDHQHALASIFRLGVSDRMALAIVREDFPEAHSKPCESNPGIAI